MLEGGAAGEREAMAQYAAGPPWYTSWTMRISPMATPTGTSPTVKEHLVASTDEAARQSRNLGNCAHDVVRASNTAAE